MKKEADFVRSVVDDAENDIATTPEGTLQNRFVNRSVSFNSQAECCDVRHITDYSAEEKARIWYTEAELQGIRNECGETIKAAVRCGPELPVEMCMRGLEMKTPDGSKFRKQTRRAATNAVIEEQNTQRNMEMHDPEYLANIYKRVTLDAKKIALHMAVKDAEEVGSVVDMVSEVSRRKAARPGKPNNESAQATSKDSKKNKQKVNKEKKQSRRQKIANSLSKTILGKNYDKDMQRNFVGAAA